MSPIIILLIAAFGISFLTGMLALYYYNAFSKQKVKLEEAFGNISLFMQKRMSSVEQLQPLVSQLDEVASVAVREYISIGRSSTIAPGHSSGMAQLDNAASRILKGAQGFNVSREIESAIQAMERAEVELNGSKRYYNALAREHNEMVRRLPGALVALLFKFKEVDYIQSEQA